MNRENTEKLYNDFPELYKQRSLPMSQTCMCWGFECNDTWFDLIYQLSKDLSALDVIPEATQVKEKFGGLRFYTNSSTYEAEALIDIAEEASYKVK